MIYPKKIGRITSGFHRWILRPARRRAEVMSSAAHGPVAQRVGGTQRRGKEAE